MLVIENSSREQTRQETDQMDETLNEEEIAADCTISDTFQKMMVKSSPNIFQLVFRKIKHHVQTRILEPAVSNKIILKSTRRMSDVKPTKIFSINQMLILKLTLEYRLLEILWLLCARLV